MCHQHYTKLRVNKAVIVCKRKPHGRLSLFNKAFKANWTQSTSRRGGNRFQPFVAGSISSVREAQVTSHLANRTQHESECDSGPEPAIFKNTTSTLKVEHMSAVQLRTGKKKKSLILHEKKFYPEVNGTHTLIFRATCTAGAAERASVKQIIHMSSASCFRQPVFLSQPCRHGRQLSSFLTPPQGCPQGWVLLQASLAYSWGRQHEKNWWGSGTTVAYYYRNA